MEITDKVFNKEDLRRIWFLFSKQKFPEEYYFPPLTMQIVCADRTRYESSDEELLNDGNLLDLKKVNRIDFTYRNSELDQEISLSVAHGNSGRSELTISGNNRDWIAGTFSALKDILDAVKPQQHWFLKFEK